MGIKKISIYDLIYSGLLVTMIGLSGYVAISLSLKKQPSTRSSYVTQNHSKVDTRDAAIDNFIEILNGYETVLEHTNSINILKDKDKERYKEDLYHIYVNPKEQLRFQDSKPALKLSYEPKEGFIHLGKYESCEKLTLKDHEILLHFVNKELKSIISRYYLSDGTESSLSFEKDYPSNGDRYFNIYCYKPGFGFSEDLKSPKLLESVVRLYNAVDNAFNKSRRKFNY